MHEKDIELPADHKFKIGEIYQNRLTNEWWVCFHEEGIDKWKYMGIAQTRLEDY